MNNILHLGLPKELRLEVYRHIEATPRTITCEFDHTPYYQKGHRNGPKGRKNVPAMVLYRYRMKAYGQSPLLGISRETRTEFMRLNPRKFNLTTRNGGATIYFKDQDTIWFDDRSLYVLLTFDQLPWPATNEAPSLQMRGYGNARRRRNLEGRQTINNFSSNRFSLAHRQVRGREYGTAGTPDFLDALLSGPHPPGSPWLRQPVGHRNAMNMIHRPPPIARVSRYCGRKLIAMNCPGRGKFTPAQLNVIAREIQAMRLRVNFFLVP